MTPANDRFEEMHRGTEIGVLQTQRNAASAIAIGAQGRFVRWADILGRGPAEQVQPKPSDVRFEPKVSNAARDTNWYTLKEADLQRFSKIDDTFRFFETHSIVKRMAHQIVEMRVRSKLLTALVFRPRLN